MRFRIRRCPACGRYTLKELCPLCGARTVNAHPPRFSPEDKYVMYRVRSKYPQLLKMLEGGTVNTEKT